MSEEPDETEMQETAAKLDELIRKYNAENQQRQGVVTGWVLMTASSFFDPDGDMHYCYDYSVGRDTDLVRAVGLVRMGMLQMEHDIVRSPRFSDSDE